MKTPLDDITHEVIKEDDKWVYGKTYHDKTFFCDWVKYKGSGNPHTQEQLMMIENTRIQKAVDYRKKHPWVSTPEYLAAIERYPLKEIN